MGERQQNKSKKCDAPKNQLEIYFFLLVEHSIDFPLNLFCVSHYNFLLLTGTADKSPHESITKFEAFD